MSAPTPAELLEEYSSEVGATSDDLFRVWFDNHASESLKSRVDHLMSLKDFKTTEKAVLEMLDDVVDVWIEDAEEDASLDEIEEAFPEERDDPPLPQG